MAELASCMEPLETASGVHFPCVRELGHAGEHSPGACGHPFHYAGNEQACSLRRGHVGQHDTWVREADEAKEFEQYGDRDDAMREALGW